MSSRVAISLVDTRPSPAGQLVSGGMRKSIDLRLRQRVCEKSPSRRRSKERPRAVGGWLVRRDDFWSKFPGTFRGLRDTFEGPATLCGRVSVLRTEQCPRAKDGLGLEVFGLVSRPVCVVSETRMLGAQFSVATIWLQPYFGSVRDKTPERVYVEGSLASGQTGEFDDCSRIPNDSGLTIVKGAQILARAI